MNIFLCDITKTFDGDLQRDKELNIFIDEINLLIENDNLDNLFFSFLTNESMKKVLPYIKELEARRINFHDCLHLGKQFSSDEIYLDGDFVDKTHKTKIDQIRNLIENNKIDKIYFASSNYFDQFFIPKLISLVYKEIEVFSLYPSCDENKQLDCYKSNKKGLVGLNHTLTLYNQNQKILVKKMKKRE